MKAGELEARESIRDLVARYNASGDAGRIDEVLELFAEGARLVVPPDRQLDGKPAIRAFFESVVESTRAGRARPSPPAHFVRHFTATHQIDPLGPNEARGRCYYAVLTDRGLDHWGRYVDEYRREAGVWLFWRRTCTIDGQVPGSWAGQAVPAPGLRKRSPVCET